MERTSRLKEIFEDNDFLSAALLERCPSFVAILSFILENKLNFHVKNVGGTVKMIDWGEEECKRVGRSLATFIWSATTGEHAVDAWRLHYAQLNVLFEEVEGFEEFMRVIANNLLRDSIYGMVLRVSVGAALSTLDAVTDIYVIITYYQSKELYGQANAMLAMILCNLLLQMLSVQVQYKKKSRAVKVKEALITMLFLRPAVDAYRVSTNHEDNEVNIDPLAEMVLDKCCELACESVPGCVLQMYVWLSKPELAGTFALASIGISCLTTGFTSALISFDMDLDVPHRKNQPKFYGYIPNEHGARGRCFILMTVISTLHNMSRSFGCALLALSDKDNLLPLFLPLFIGSEIGLYLLFKIGKGDLFYWIRQNGATAIFGSVFARLVVKVIVDFSGCIHFRHPYEMGGPCFTISLLWAQVLPFVALVFFADKGHEVYTKDNIIVFLASTCLLWLILNVAFFCTIDLSYLNTFFRTKTAPEYTCELFLTSKEDYQKFRAMFKNRIEYTKSIHGDVKDWVAANIDQWRRDEPEWFKIEKIPDEFLPKNVFEAVGGAKRRRSSVGLGEFVGLREENERRVHPQAVEDMRIEDL